MSKRNNYNNPFETQEVFTSLLSTKLKEELIEWSVGDSLKVVFNYLLLCDFNYITLRSSNNCRLLL